MYIMDIFYVKCKYFPDHVGRVRSPGPGGGRVPLPRDEQVQRDVQRELGRPQEVLEQNLSTVLLEVSYT